MIKYCPKCETEKSDSEFHKNCSRKDGLSGWCKACKTGHDQGYYQSHRIEIAEQHRSPAGKVSHCRRSKKYRRNNPEKIKAQHAVNDAVRAGKLQRPSFCESCFQEKSVHGHHEDYSKPLEVDWLCIKCHRDKRPCLTELHKEQASLLKGGIVCPS